MLNQRIRKSSVIAFRATPVLAQQLKEMAAKDQVRLSSWLNLRAQKFIEEAHTEAENNPVQERLL